MYYPFCTSLNALNDLHCLKVHDFCHSKKKKEKKLQFKKMIFKQNYIYIYRVFNFSFELHVNSEINK